MLRATFLLILLCVSACSIPPVATISSGWLVSEYLYDRSPISLAAEFFSKNCEIKRVPVYLRNNTNLSIIFTLFKNMHF